MASTETHASEGRHMRRALRLSGTLLVAGSLLGLALLAGVTVLPDGVLPTPAGPIELWWHGGATTTGRSRTSTPLTSSGSVAATTNVPIDHPITRVSVPAIDLDAEVVPADMVPVDGGYTWQVPAFKVGHAETTAGAGQAGNAILLGHVTSVHSGNVFQDLSRVRVGDEVQVFSNTDEFLYHVVATDPVSRSDSSVLQPTQTPSVSLITCTGVWLPTIWDYTERLVVRAEIVQ